MPFYQSPTRRRESHGWPFRRDQARHARRNTKRCPSSTEPKILPQTRNTKYFIGRSVIVTLTNDRCQGFHSFLIVQPVCGMFGTGRKTAPGAEFAAIHERPFKTTLLPN